MCRAPMPPVRFPVVLGGRAGRMHDRQADVICDTGGARVPNARRRGRCLVRYGVTTLIELPNSLPRLSCNAMWRKPTCSS